jgi:hypothetical protein
MTAGDTIGVVVWGTGNMGRAVDPGGGRPPRPAPGGRAGRTTRPRWGGTPPTSPACPNRSGWPPPMTSMPSWPRRRPRWPTWPRATSGPTTRHRRRVPGPAGRRGGGDPGDLSALRPGQRTRRGASTRSTPRPAEGSAALFVSGIDPGWGNDILPALLTGLSGTIDQIRCQEIFDYSTYDQPDSVRYLVGMGQPMDYEPMMVAAHRPDHGVGRPDPPHRPGPRASSSTRSARRWSAANWRPPSPT